MRILNGVKGYEVMEANFESLRLALNFLGGNYSPAYFHGIAGTVFRAGGICPCAPTCTTAMTPQQLIALLGYDYEELPFAGEGSGDVERMIGAVRASIDDCVPALVWNAMTPCEWNVVTGYDEDENVFYGRVPWQGGEDEYEKRPWDQSKENAGLVGLTAILIRGKSGSLDRRSAEIAALYEAVRHANDAENTDKLGGDDWVFLQGKAALRRWAEDFAKPDKDRGLGDAYCMDIYASCHSRAGEFLQMIAGDYPSASGALLSSAQHFDSEAEALRGAAPLLTWSSPSGVDSQRNAKAYPLLKAACENYAAAIDALESALPRIAR